MSNNSFGVVDKEYTGRRVTQQGPIAANQPIELPIYISDKQQVMVHINNGTNSRLLTIDDYEYSAGATSYLYLPTINVSASETVHVMFLGAVPYDQVALPFNANNYVRKYAAGSALPTTSTGDVIYVGTDRYEWIGGVYRQIKPIALNTTVNGYEEERGLTITVIAPKAGVLYITGLLNVVQQNLVGGPLALYINDINVRGDVSKTSTALVWTQSVGAGAYTVELIGRGSSNFTLHLSVLYTPN